METPKQLDDYFVMVHDFLYKSFRDDCKLFLALKSTHRSNISLSQQQSSAATTSKKGGDGEATSASSSSNAAVSLSPRLLLREDGSSFGKVKMALNMNIPEVCDVSQKIIVDTDGKASGSLQLKELIDGLKIRGTIVVNTIAPATEDDSAIHAQFFKNDFYCSTAASKNGFGTTATGVDFGGRFQDLILGAGITRKFFSAEEADQRMLTMQHQQDEDTQVYIGGGMHGKNWAFGGRLVRVNDLWNNAELAMFRKIEASTAVACAYGFDLGVSKAHLTLGASQAFSLRLPVMLVPRDYPPLSHNGPQPIWTSPIPLVGAVKGDSFGNVLATLRGMWNNSLEWGIVAKKNLCDPTSRWSLGVQLTMQDAAE
jgi:hypothetical protein